MVHLGLEYMMGAHHFKIFVLFCGGSSCPMPCHPIIYVCCPKIWWNLILLLVRWMCIYFILDQHTWYLCITISNNFLMDGVYFASFFVYYFFVPHPITPSIWQMFQVSLVCFDRIHIWNLSGCSNHGPIPIFGAVGVYFWGLLLSMEIWNAGKSNVFVLRMQ